MIFKVYNREYSIVVLRDVMMMAMCRPDSIAMTVTIVGTTAANRGVAIPQCVTSLSLLLQTCLPRLSLLRACYVWLTTAAAAAAAAAPS